MLSKVRARLPDPNMIDTRGPANLHYHIHYLWYWAFCFTCRWAFPGDQRLLVLLLILLVAYGTALIWNGLSELRRGFSVARHHTDKLEGPWINSPMRKEADNQDRPPRPWTQIARLDLNQIVVAPSCSFNTQTMEWSVEIYFFFSFSDEWNVFPAWKVRTEMKTRFHEQKGVESKRR